MNIKLVFLVILLNQNCFAALLLEPRLQVYQGSLKVGSEQSDFLGQGQGLDLGYMGEHFLFGITLEKNHYRFQESFLDRNTKSYHAGGIGTFIGYHFLDRLRIQTTYINTSLEPTTQKNFRYFGQYFAYGLGLRLSKGLMFNLIQFNNTYTQKEEDETGQTNGLVSNIRSHGQSAYLSYIFAIH